MPAYARKTTIDDQFAARRAPSGAILCGRCNSNLADLSTNPTGAVYLLYVDRAHLKADMPHDVYCEDCLASGFPRAKIV